MFSYFYNGVNMKHFRFFGSSDIGWAGGWEEARLMTVLACVTGLETDLAVEGGTGGGTAAA